MWKQNLLFWFLAACGVVALGGMLAPTMPSAESAPVAPEPVNPAVAHVVDAVNNEFHDSWDQQGLQPADLADSLTVARRISLALVGTIPSLEEIRLLEQLPEDVRVRWWTDRLLEDPRSSDYLAERFARVFVGTEEGPFLVYRRRRFVAWLTDELQQNHRYDDIVRRLIAQDGIWTDQPATNFVTATIDPNNDEVDERRLAGRVTRAFLGIRIDCAECHDHPFADWTQQDFHGLAAYFSGAENSITGIHDSEISYELEHHETGELQSIDPHVPFQTNLIGDENDPRWQLAKWVTHPENKAFPRATVNRLWAIMTGRALVEPIDNIDPHDVPPVLDLLATDFVDSNFNIRHLIRSITATEVFQLDSRGGTLETPAATADQQAEKQIRAAEQTATQHWARFPITRLRSEQVVGGILQSTALKTIDHESHIIVRIARAIGQQEFIERYGDAGEAELDPQAGTIPQRLLLMNGKLVKERTKSEFNNASSRIASLSPDDARAIEAAYLITLTRRPSPDEQAYFAARLDGTSGDQRYEHLEDLCWTLLNSSEFSWNH